MFLVKNRAHGFHCETCERPRVSRLKPVFIKHGFLDGPTREHNTVLKGGTVMPVLRFAQNRRYGRRVQRRTGVMYPFLDMKTVLCSRVGPSRKPCLMITGFKRETRERSRVSPWKPWALTISNCETREHCFLLRIEWNVYKNHQSLDRNMVVWLLDNSWQQSSTWTQR